MNYRLECRVSKRNELIAEFDGEALAANVLENALSTVVVCCEKRGYPGRLSRMFNRDGSTVFDMGVNGEFTLTPEVNQAEVYSFSGGKEKAEINPLGTTDLFIEMENDVSVRVRELIEKGVIPVLSVVTVGLSPETEKRKNEIVSECKRVGIDCVQILFENTETMLFDTVMRVILCNPTIILFPGEDVFDEEIQGLGECIGKSVPISSSPVPYDVSGLFSRRNRVFLRNKTAESKEPCVSSAVFSILKRNEIELEGRVVCVLGNGLISKSVSETAMSYGATAVICHNGTSLTNTAQMVRMADVVISATSEPALLLDNDFARNFKVDFSNKVLVEAGDGFAAPKTNAFSNAVKRASKGCVSISDVVRVSDIILVKNTVETYQSRYSELAEN